MNAATMARRTCRVAWYLMRLSIMLIAGLSLAASMRAERVTTVLLQGPFGFVSVVLDECVWVCDVRRVSLAMPIGWEADVQHFNQASVLEDLRETAADDLETPGARVWHGPGLGFCYDPAAGVTYTFVYLEHKVVWLMAAAVLVVEVCHRLWQRCDRVDQAMAEASP
ncbi:MAG: hypothetical protein NXI04_10280 [Planctomycetaceae bacterium]|nr:hypothetical protein [Planctomycetaceae bacterium]